MQYARCGGDGLCKTRSGWIFQKLRNERLYPGWAETLNVGTVELRVGLRLA